MALQSMTGFARVEGRLEAPSGTARWVWELRSVNAKGLDIRLRLPPGFESIELECRKAIGSKLARGNIQASLRYEAEGQVEMPTVNRDALEAVIVFVEELRERLGSPPPAAEAILSIRGVMDVATREEDEAATARRNSAILAGLDRAMAELIAARSAEGNQIALALHDELTEIGRLTEALAANLDEERLYQEAALLATRADLREEIDRLAAHVVAALELLAAGGPVGRKLDFLAQEFNRESNTICSKSNAASVTRLGLEMKVVIDQFREQVQNIE